MFVLSEDTPFEQCAEQWALTAQQEPAFWLTPVHTQLPRMGLVIRAGCAATFHFQANSGRCALLLTFGAGLPKISADGLDMTLRIAEGGSSRVLMRHHVPAFDPEEPWI